MSPCGQLSDSAEALVEGGHVFNDAQRPLSAVGRSRPLVQQEEAFGGSPVLSGHEVVDDGVDGRAQVAQHHRRHVEVLAEHGRVVIVHLGEQVPTDVVGQPADDEGQYHNHS